MADDIQVLQAITVVRDYLQRDFICDSCRDHAMFGCVSCQALALDQQLQMLADVVGDSSTDKPHHPAE